MGDHDDRDAVIAVQPLQQRKDLMAALTVEIAGRLIGKDHRRISGQRAGNRHPLLLAARELRGLVMLAPRQPDPGQRVPRCLRPRRRRQPLIDQRQLDIFLRRAARQQVETLEYKAKVMPPQQRHRIRGHTPDIGAAKEIGPRCRPVEPADHIHRGGFPRARRPHDRDELALFDHQIDLVEGANLGLALTV